MSILNNAFTYQEGLQGQHKKTTKVSSERYPPKEPIYAIDFICSSTQ